jgi:hypothetical protein
MQGSGVEEVSQRHVVELGSEIPIDARSRLGRHLAITGEERCT